MNKDAPPEILQQIASLLEPMDLFRCSRVNRSWRPVFWDQLWGSIDDGVELWHSLFKNPTPRRSKVHTKKHRRTYDVTHFESGIAVRFRFVYYSRLAHAFAYNEIPYVVTDQMHNYIRWSLNGGGAEDLEDDAPHMYSCQQETMRQLDVEHWCRVQPLFAANGHKIQHLTIRHPMTARVTLATKCTGLVSLNLILDHRERVAAPWIRRDRESILQTEVLDGSFMADWSMAHSEDRMLFPFEEEIMVIENQYDEDVANASIAPGVDDWPSYWRWEALQMVETQWAMVEDRRRELEDLLPL